MSPAPTPARGWRGWLLSDAPRSGWQARAGRFYLGWRRFAVNPLAMVGLAIVGGLVLLALLAPVIAPGSPVDQDLGRRLLPPGGDALLGTDDLGRSIYTRLVHGARLTLLIVVMVAIIAAPVGLAVGTVAGYFGGWTDRILMRITDIFLAFPRLVLALAFVAALGPGIENAIIAIAITAWPPYARIARAETITIRRSDCLAAARLQGASSGRIIWGHVVPLCTASVIVRVSLDMAGIILTAAGLGFLGLGAQPPNPEWGLMIADGRKVLIGHWWVATIPGIAICLVALGFNLIGDGLRDVLDPKATGR